MTPPPMNLFGLLAAAVVRIALAMAWYSPMAFWPAWSRLTGMSMDAARKSQPLAFIVDVVGSFLMAFILLHAIYYAGARTLPLGLAVAFLNWLGFVAVVLLSKVAYEQQPLGLFGIYAGYHLVSMLAMGAILTLWGIRWG